MGWMMFAAVCAYFVKGLCGFANTLVFSTILSFSTNNVNISPVELVLGLPSNIMISYKERKSVQCDMYHSSRMQHIARTDARRDRPKRK